MDQNTAKELAKDPDGLLTYEYIANNIADCASDMDFLVENMIKVDQSGQFVVSAARYLNAINPQLFAPAIQSLVAAAIEKDRERRYLGDLLLSLYGPDYKERAEQLSASDNNFRRIYKRLYPGGSL